MSIMWNIYISLIWKMYWFENYVPYFWRKKRRAYRDTCLFMAEFYKHFQELGQSNYPCRWPKGTESSSAGISHCGSERHNPELRFHCKRGLRLHILHRQQTREESRWVREILGNYVIFFFIFPFSFFYLSFFNFHDVFQTISSWWRLDTRTFQHSSSQPKHCKKPVERRTATSSQKWIWS